MTSSPHPSVEHFFYRSAVQSRRHRNRVSAYLVHRFEGAVVLARIEPLGLVPVSLYENEMALQGLRRNLRVVGPWVATSSHRHTRARLSQIAYVAPRTR
ncbi:MAG: hypothetical protein HKL86_05530 [Acidimicrobiaceae bacterium]|nr:hypothetical protein [Acidimicrobiaceae bacterium]